MAIEFDAFPRSAHGTGANRRLRGTGKVPGIIYGAQQPTRAIELDHHALYRHLKTESFHASILDMTFEGVKQQVLLRDVQMHPFRPMILHVDFQRIDKSKKIHMRVPLHFTNAEINPSVKLGGGVINHIMNDVEVQCLPDDLPEFIEVSLDTLELGHSLHVNDLQLPTGVEIVSHLKKENPAVVTVHLPKVVAAEEAAAAPVTEITGQEPEAEGAAAKEGDKGDKGDKKEAGDKKDKK